MARLSSKALAIALGGGSEPVGMATTSRQRNRRNVRLGGGGRARRRPSGGRVPGPGPDTGADLLLGAIFEGAPDAIVITDDEGVLRDANPPTFEMFGRARKRLIGRPISEFVRADFDIASALKELREKKRHTGELRVVRPDGTTLDVEFASAASILPNRHVAILRDITPWKQAADAMKDSAERYRLLFELNPMPMWIFDRETLEIIDVNATAVGHYGYTRDEFLSLSLRDLRPPEDIPALREAERGEVPGVSSRGIWRHKKKDGTILHVEVFTTDIVFRGRAARLVAASDVTDRRSAEDALARSERKYRALFEGAADAIVLVDRLANILDVNPAAERLLGRGRPDLVGFGLGDFLPGEDLERCQEYFRSVVRGRAVVEPFEVSLVRADGSRRSLQVTARVVREPDMVPYVGFVARDVTGERGMQQRLLQSERLASMGELAASVAHEINTPLTNIGLLAEAVARRVTEPGALERLEKIGVQQRNAARIISDLLRYARRRTLQKVETDLREVVDTAVEQARAHQAPGVTIVREFGDRPVLAWVDVTQTQEVFVNIVKNALQATKTGTVTVRVEERGDEVSVSIRDTGAGIPPDVMPLIFDPFFTTKKLGDGTGLGLSLCKNIVSNHNGRIEAESAVGRGSTFTVLLPKGKGP